MRKALKVITTLAILSLAISGCSNSAQNKTVTLATHDSFVMSNTLIAEFEKQTGYKLEIVKMGDAGELTNKLVLTKDAPVADAFFGIDNTFAGVAQSNRVVDGAMTKIDYADVCFNYDINWFKAHSLAAPSSWLELTDPKYRRLTVIENPQTSSTGLAFLFATIAKLGDDTGAPIWKWWSEMRNNAMKIDAGWEQAYYTDFSGSSGRGSYPIVLSYSSSPADEVDADGKARTASINRDCFRQIEYAGVLSHASNPDGAKALVKFMLSHDFQSALPEAMYVYPVTDGVKIPSNWQKFAPASSSFVDTSGLNFDAMRSTWLKKWLAAVSKY